MSDPLNCVICKKVIPEDELDFARYPEYHPGILGPLHVACYEKAVEEVPDLPWTDPISGQVDYREMGEALGFTDPEDEMDHEAHYFE